MLRYVPKYVESTMDDVLLRKTFWTFLRFDSFLIICSLMPADFEVLDDANAGRWGAMGPRALYCHHNSQDACTDVIFLWRTNRWWHL